MKAKIFLRNIGWGLMTFLSIGIVIVASRYLSMDPNVYFPNQREVYMAQQFGIMAHVIGGILALGLGPFQFITKLRSKWPNIHRWIGRFYLIGILIGGLAGLYMAFYAYAGIAASLGFGGLAVSWLFTGYHAYRTIRAGDTVAHRKWMIRNFALTFAAVTLRLWMPFLMMAFGEVTGYEVTAWVCWVPNLLIVESHIQGWFKRK